MILTILTSVMLLAGCNEHSAFTAPRARCVPTADTLRIPPDTLVIASVDSACAITATTTITPHG